MKIGLDYDDVIFPWSRYAHEACEAAGITNGKQVTQWAMYLDYGCTSEVLWRALDGAYLGGMLLRQPYEGVQEVLADLRDAGHTIHIATARGFEGRMATLVREHTVQNIADYGIPHDSLTFTKDKTIIGADVFLDDSIPNVVALRAAGVDAYLNDQCHNRSDTELPRVANLAAFAASIA